ncbi:MAG TPA: tRNA guanosine(34) transglycosylase Tgt [Aeromicrobium sp.]|nr:tRNA guanosine(34) transglycosylase Tgt [Aeromicrobium sp.]
MPSPTFSIAAGDGRARSGVLSTPHGDIRTPAFIPVGTRATVKAVLPRDLAAIGAQAVLGNAYHLYLQPGDALVEEAGGLGAFMAWQGPTFTDSGGFQVLSLGAGFKKTLSMDPDAAPVDDVIAPGKERLAKVDEDGVTFRSHIDGSAHRFTPEASIGIQHRLGADIIFAFDELTTLMNSFEYQRASVERTHRWAERSLAEHRRRSADGAAPRQLLFGVVQGAQHEDLRRRAAAGLAGMTVDGGSFDGFGIGGAIDKHRLGEIVDWVVDELPDDKPRHLLGIGEPEDLFVGVEHGCDTFDCVQPTRVARTGRVYTATGRRNLTVAAARREFRPIEDDCDCPTCASHTVAYLHHLLRTNEYLGATLLSLHNLRFYLRLVDRMRTAIEAGELAPFKQEFLGRYTAGSPAQ